MGLDSSDFDKSLSLVDSKATRAAAALNNGFNNAGKSVSKTGYRMGQFGMQTQDVAVQMQNAADKTRALFTVTAQQAPQFLGVLGTKGAVIGGVVAIGAALGTAVYESQKNFSAMMAHAEEFSGELASISKSGGITELVSGLKSAAKETATLQKEIDDYTKGMSGYFATYAAEIAKVFGGDGAVDRIVKVGEAQDKVNQAEAIARQRLIQLAEREIEVQKLRQSGQNELADKIQREIDLQKELAKIQESTSDAFVKGKLKEIEAQKDKTKQLELEKEKAKEVADNQKKHDEEVLRANNEWVRAQEQGEAAQIAKLSIADRLALANQKVADAEKQVAKETKGTLGWYKEMAKLQSARNDAQELFSQRASNYGKSFSQGRRADREMEKEVKRQQRGERRLREAEARKGQGVRGAASGLGNQQQRGNNIQPKGPAAAPMPAQAGNEMSVAVLKVGKLEPK